MRINIVNTATGKHSVFFTTFIYQQSFSSSFGFLLTGLYKMKYALYIALFNYLRNKSYPIGATESIKSKIRKKAKKYLIHGGKIYEKAMQDEQEQLGRVLLHEGTMNEAIRTVHEEGHFGINNTWAKVKLKYCGKGLFKEVKSFVAACDTCQFRQKIRHAKVTPAHPVPTPSRPFYLVGTDCVGPIDETPSGNKYIMVAIDYLTKWPIARAVKEISAETTERFLFEEIIVSFGVPSFLVTDRGSNYIAEYLQDFLRKVECHHRKTTARRPNSNGQVERLNGTLVQTMAKLMRDDGEDARPWDEYIPAALMAIRTMTNEATKYSPSMLLYGYDIRTPSTWIPPRYDYVVGEIEEEIAKRARFIDEWLTKVRQEARASTEIQKQRRKVIYDNTVTFQRKYKLNDKVLMKDHYPANKFADRYIGPLVVVKVNEKTNTYYLTGPNQRRIQDAVHGDVLVPYNENKRMVPDIMVSRAMNRFQTWIDRSRED